MADHSPFTVLCVDDDADNRSSLTLLLRYENYHVLEAETGTVALALAAKADLVILDVQLPDLSGFEVCRRLKAAPATAAVPIILLSGHFTRSEDMAGGLEGGGDVYLTKPADPLVLLGQVKALRRIREAELRAQEAARQAEEGRRRLRAVTDHAPVLIAQVDTDTRYTFVNRPYAARFGLAPDDLIGRRVIDVLGEQAYHAIAPHVEAALAGRRVEFEAEIPYAALGVQYMHAAYEPEFDESGRTRGLIAAITNVTDRVRAEAEVRQWRDRYEAAVRASGHLLYDWNAATGEVAYGSNAEAVLGYTPAELGGGLEHWLGLVHPDDRPAFLGEIERVKKTSEPFRLEYRVRHKDGPYLHVRDDGHFVGGGTAQMVGFVADVTERRHLEEQARQAQRMEAVGQLAGGLAHALNNLMTVINGFADIVMADLAEDDPQRVRVQEIRRSGDRAASLTQQLLAFGRKQILQLKVLDLNEVVTEMEKALRRAVGGAATVVVRPGPRLGLVKADLAQIRQVMLILAVNAAEAMPDGGTLAVETRNVELGEEYAKACAEVRPGPYVLLSVSDTGTGMTESVKARVFEPFFTTKPEGEGNSGLGLASVYGIVKQSGGHVEVESTVGAGTTFKVYLPRLTE